MTNPDSRNVLYYVDRYLPPSQAFIRQQARALQRYKPSFLTGQTLSSSESLAEFPVQDIRRSIPLRASELALKVLRTPLPPLIESVRRADLVHAHFGKNGYVVHPLAAKAARPLVTTFHGFDATYQGDPKGPGGFNSVRFFSRGRQEMTGWNSWQIAVSDFIQDKLLELGFDESRVFRHYIGVDTALFRPQEKIRRPGRVVSIARFVEYKGHSFMIEALRRAVAAGADVDFVMVGQGPLRGEIEALARKVLPKVTIHDRLSQAEIRDLLSEAQIYLHGSVTLDNGHAEAMGIANLEAEALGTPVVAFRSGGVGEAVEDGASGYLFAERDVEGMAGAVVRLLQDEALWSAFSHRATQLVPERFDIRRQSASLEAFYDDVIDRFGQGARK
ncbi:glycosyltransferase [Pseudomonas sp. ODNR1LW]|nr:glycosyltransferase [Pseudomonas sp. ODNR1LW]